MISLRHAPATPSPVREMVSCGRAMDRLGSLSAFVQSAETRNFTMAGRTLGISSSAVGKAVARLEERLAVRLFHRSTRSISLTPEGELLLRRCRRISTEIEAAESELSRASTAPCGRLRVSLPPMGPQLTAVLAAFVQAFPQVELDLDFSDRAMDMIDEGFDIALRTGDPGDSRLMTRALGSYGHAVVAAPAYLQSRAPPAQRADLGEHLCLHQRAIGTGRIEAWRLDDVEAESDLPIAAVATSIEALVSLAERGLGLAWLPAFIVRPHVDAGTLVQVMEGSVIYRGVLRALWPSSRHATPKTRAFLDFMGRRLPATLA